MTQVPVSTKEFHYPARMRSVEEHGDKPTLKWLSIADLRIDKNYQREIMKRGKSNVYYIAENFDWRMFAPIIVAELADGNYAIVDGQHRVTAAKLCGISKVPCQIIIANAQQQAIAFAVINSRITQISTMQIFAANLAAGDSKAKGLAAACREAGVSILRYPVPHTRIKAGETMAVTCLQRAFTRYPRQVFIRALQCITQTGDGNPGMVRVQVINALCAVLEEEQDWCSSWPALRAAMSKINLSREYEEATVDSRINRRSVTMALIDRLLPRLQERMDEAA